MRECEELVKIVQRSRDSQLDLVSGSWLAIRQKVAHVPSMLEVEVSCQLEHYRIKSTD